MGTIGMDYKALTECFYEKVYPSRPNEWDTEDVLTELEYLDEDLQKRLLRAVPAIWPVSHSLAFSFLKEGAQQIADLDQDALAEWLRRILYKYERGGLREAREYMAFPDAQLVDGTAVAQSARLDNCMGRLTAYARGVSGLDLKLVESTILYTDTESLYLPAKVKIFQNRKQNLLYYKMAIGVLSTFILQGSFGRHRFPESKGKTADGKQSGAYDAQRYFEAFSKPELARDIYQLVELYKAFRNIGEELQGLLKETKEIRRRLWHMRDQAKSDMLERFFALAVVPELATAGSGTAALTPILELLDKRKNRITEAKVFEDVYNFFLAEENLPEYLDFYPFMDKFNFSEAQLVRENRIKNNRRQFTVMMADLLRKHGKPSGEKGMDESSASQVDAVRLSMPADNDKTQNRKHTLTINNASIELPQDLQDLINRIQADLGKVPEGYVASAFGMAGHGRSVGQGETEYAEEVVGEFIPYDEWDYRRHGYRKNWCSLRERTLQGIRSDFVERTLAKYHGPLLKIRRQFEMMRTQEHFARRRRHGDDLDLDALIDSMGDRQAGLAPSEKLFVRLIRNERSISTLFMVDMSNSTEGWVGRAIKEALVLLCEAMQVIGDPYGIYGFSGMRRMRSEVYTIKKIEETYTGQVRERIAAITPKEYTRMGPPIRHLIHKFKAVDTKSRLLFMLSDGKPEDYDDYKGRYAIEDTRKALAEARGCGIHPYCITIDREAHDYLEYLFGAGSYTYVKNLQQLPARLADIYRMLTK